MTRLRCVVPFCNHTRRHDHLAEWICANHWRMVPRRYRAAYLRHCRRRDGKARGRTNIDVRWRLWRRIKQVAKERAAGIA
jgi:hypothetical protein